MPLFATLKTFHILLVACEGILSALFISCHLRFAIKIHFSYGFFIRMTGIAGSDFPPLLIFFLVSIFLEFGQHNENAFQLFAWRWPKAKTKFINTRRLRRSISSAAHRYTLSYTCGFIRAYIYPRLSI